LISFFIPAPFSFFAVFGRNEIHRRKAHGEDEQNAYKQNSIFHRITSVEALGQRALEGKAEDKSQVCP